MSHRILRRDGLSRVSLERRRVCGWLLLPAEEYTRLILETPAPMAHQLLVMKNPERLVLDLEGVELNPEIGRLPERVLPGDPYIQAIRVAAYRPGVLRVVLDIKSEVNPQLFALKPVGDYGHRVVLDLYPLTPLDPLMALLEIERNERSLEPASAESSADKPSAAHDRAGRS